MPSNKDIENKQETPVTFEQQVETLYAQIREIAKTVVEIDTIEKNTNQKATVIGKALITQKGTVANLTEKQNQQYQKNQDQFKQSKQQQSELLEHVNDVEKQLETLESFDERQKRLAESLIELQNGQQSFVENNQAHTEHVSKRLEAIGTVLTSLQDNIVNIEIEDQIAFVKSKINDIQTLLTTYTKERATLQTAMTNQIESTEAKLSQFKEDMDKQMIAVQKIEAIASTYEEKTIRMNEKLDKMLSSHPFIPDVENISLEEMFTVTSEKVEDEIEDIKGYVKETPKKKGFFARMFGGN